MTDHQTRRRLACGLAAAGLTLTGCAGSVASPGSAATVGGAELSRTTVDNAARTVCAALQSGVQGQAAAESTLPMSFISRGVVQLLTLDLQARQIAEAHDVEAGADYERERTTNRRAAVALPPKQRDLYADVMSAGARASSVLEQVGAVELRRRGVSNPSARKIQQAGTELFRSWAAEHTFEVDPRYGLGLEEGQLRPTDTGLSVAVSGTAKAATSEVPDPARAAALPAHLRCG